MVKPLVTVGLMTYNNAEYVEKAITSVLNQKFEDWELIISDDNSKDNTEEVICPYLNDPRITYVKHSPNLGQAKNWSYLIENANGKYFATLHADDYWDANYLQTVAEFIEQYNPQVIQLNWKFVDESDKVSGIGPVTKSKVLKGTDIFYDQLDKFTTLPSATVFDRGFALSGSQPNPSYRYAVDFEFFVKLASRAKISCQVGKDLVFYRILHTSATSNHGKGENWKKERHFLAENLIQYFKDANFDNRAYKKFKLKMAKWALISASQYAKGGQAKETISDIAEAISASPLILMNASSFAKIFVQLLKKSIK